MRFLSDVEIWINFKSMQHLSKKWEDQSNPHSNISDYYNELMTQFNLQTPLTNISTTKKTLATDF